MISPEEVKNLASLARLDLSPAEIEKLPHDLDAVLAYVGELKGVNASVEATASQVGKNYNRLREDANPDPSRESGDYVRVKKIL